MRLLVVICDRRYTEKILKLMTEKDINYHFTCFAKGTANSEILSYFGLAEVQKEVILTVVHDEVIKDIMDKLGDVELIKNHGAVAFAIPLNGIGKNTLSFIAKLEENNE